MARKHFVFGLRITCAVEFSLYRFQHTKGTFTLIEDDSEPMNAMEKAILREFNGNCSVCGDNDIELSNLVQIFFLVSRMVFVDLESIRFKMSILVSLN